MEIREFKIAPLLHSLPVGRILLLDDNEVIVLVQEAAEGATVIRGYVCPIERITSEVQDEEDDDYIPDLTESDTVVRRWRLDRGWWQQEAP